MQGRVIAYEFNFATVLCRMRRDLAIRGSDFAGKGLLNQLLFID